MLYRLANVAFQVDPVFEDVEEETANPQLRFAAKLSLGEKFHCVTKGIGPNKKSAKE